MAVGDGAGADEVAREGGTDGIGEAHATTVTIEVRTVIQDGRCMSLIQPSAAGRSYSEAGTRWCRALTAASRSWASARRGSTTSRNVASLGLRIEIQCSFA
jgi:hypothetical protein